MMERYITVTGASYYYGMKPLCAGVVVKCVKEPGNEYDGEAIRVEMPYLGLVGYVANSPRTCANGTMSAGRIYDTVGDSFFARILFTTQTKVIARVLEAAAADIEEMFDELSRTFYACGAAGDGVLPEDEAAFPEEENQT
jgi:hypothetical protein